MKNVGILIAGSVVVKLSIFSQGVVLVRVVCAAASDIHWTTCALESSHTQSAASVHTHASRRSHQTSLLLVPIGSQLNTENIHYTLCMLQMNRIHLVVKTLAPSAWDWKLRADKRTEQCRSLFHNLLPRRKQWSPNCSIISDVPSSAPHSEHRHRTSSAHLSLSPSPSSSYHAQHSILNASNNKQ